MVLLIKGPHGIMRIILCGRIKMPAQDNAFSLYGRQPSVGRPVFLDGATYSPLESTEAGVEENLLCTRDRS